ncbi:two-component system response regulator CseB [Streptomyces sp. NPDC048057]|uniref:two-component system response regulator CseB n=1 Tax=Streptomyces sp. NPDC048057 TaxID=3155628 RepID=UPI0033FE7A39
MNEGGQVSGVSEPRVPDPLKVLLVEDDDAIRRSVQLALERYGYRVTVAADGLGGLDAFRDGDHDLLILDVMLPELDGIGLCCRIREQSQVPVLMMSALGDALNVVAGLEAGADDYVVKPVDTAVMVARIRALLRRATFRPPGSPAARAPARPSGHGGGAPLVFGDLSVDTRGMVVHRAGELVPLTPTELRLLLEFAASPGVVLDRRKLLRDVWDYGWEGDTRVVDLCVLRLRKKIGSGRIETVRGFGYKLVRG